MTSSQDPFLPAVPTFEGTPGADVEPDSELGGPPPHLIAFAALLAWALQDLALFGAGPQPELARALLPGTVLVLTAGTLLAALVGWHRGVLALAWVVLAGWVALPFVSDAGLETGLDGTGRWLPRVALAVGTILWLAPAAAARLRLGPLALAYALGALCAAALCTWRLGEAHPTSGLLVGFALLHLALGRLGERGRAARGLLIALLGVALLISSRGARALRRADLAPSQAAAGADAPNLLFVVLDTVRADHLAPYGAGRVTTPELDAFAEAHAVRYSQARSTSSWTLPSHASLFTGLYPEEHGATRPRPADAPASTVPAAAGEPLQLQAWPAYPLDPEVPTLAEELRAAGYRTGAILGNTSFLRHEFGLDRGFERYDDRPSAWMPGYLALAHLVGGAPRVGFLPYREARSVTDLALDWLDEPSPQPFFLFLNYMDAHAPYIPPTRFDRVGEERWPSDPRAPEQDLHALLYDRELAYVDSELARVLAALETGGQLERTAVVITSDHGEAFGEHGTWLHGWDLFDEVLRVPLYVKPAGALDPEALRVRSEPVTGAEVLAITRAALGRGEPVPRRRSFAGPLAQLYVTDYLIERWRARGVELAGASQFAWRDGDKKHLVSERGVQSFDLAEDPDERRPLGLPQAQQAAVRAALEAWRAQHAARPRSQAPAALGQRERERLGSLGYLGED